MSATDMDILSIEPENKEFAGRCLRLQVRVKALLESMSLALDQTEPSHPVIKFLQRLVQEGKYIPEDYLSAMERERLEFDSRGRLWYRF